MADSSPQKKQSRGFLLWIPMAVFVIYFVLPPPLRPWPPLWFERHTQRQQILERIRSVGGWIVLKRDCDALANKYKDEPYGFTWKGLDTSSLPPALAALKPTQVEFFSHKTLELMGEGGQSFVGSNVVVRISMFGGHATGGHDQPWLGLDVLCESGIASYNPKRLTGRPAPFACWTYRKITDDIYEFY